MHLVKSRFRDNVSRYNTKSSWSTRVIEAIATIYYQVLLVDAHVRDSWIKPKTLIRLGPSIRDCLLRSKRPETLGVGEDCPCCYPVAGDGYMDRRHSYMDSDR